jgi:hypothetical protein
VPLLDIPVLMSLAGSDLLSVDTVMLEKRLIARRELVTLTGVVDCRRQAVRPMTPGHPAQLPQRVLKPLAQALEAFRKADRPRLPVEYVSTKW